MVSLKQIEIRKQEKLTKVKAIGAALFFICALLVKHSRAGGDSIIERLNISYLFWPLVIVCVASGLTVLVCFIIEQISKQVEVGTLRFADDAVISLKEHVEERFIYGVIKHAFIEQAYSVTSGSLFQIRIETEGKQYNFLCEISSWGTARYVADWLKGKGVDCTFSERRVQDEVAANKAMGRLGN